MKGSGFQQKNEKCQRLIFSSIFSFIDDLWTFDNDEFENNYNDIHIDELEL